jgi:hypothetical protein
LLFLGRVLKPVPVVPEAIMETFGEGRPLMLQWLSFSGHPRRLREVIKGALAAALRSRARPRSARTPREVIKGALAAALGFASEDLTEVRWTVPELLRELARGPGRAEALRRANLSLLRQPRFAHPSPLVIGLSSLPAC